MGRWFNIKVRHAMAFVAMNAGMAVYEFQKYYNCQEQNVTAIDHMKMAVGLMEPQRQVCPNLGAVEMMIVENLLKTGAIFTVDLLTAGAKKVYEMIKKKTEKKDKFYDAFDVDENRLPYIYECIDNNRIPHYSVNHLFTVMREERLDFAKVRYILAELYAISMKKGEKQWGKELSMGAGRFFRGYSFHKYFPSEGF